MRGDKERNIQELIKAKYRSEYSNIPRVISDDKVPITEAYINLRIVTRKSAKRKEMQFFDQNTTESQAVDELRELQLKTYTSLYEEDQLELKEAVALEQIFEETSSNPAPKKIAVYGRAGIGKSVLCRLLAMKWQEGKLWKNKFEAVIWLPLRELLAYPSSPQLDTYLASIVRSKYMNGFDAPSIEEIKGYLFDRQDRNKILLILDGYDEIINSMPPMLQQLLSAMFADPHYHIIVTSRPITITIGDNPINFDQELESIGFTRENIKSYVQKFYKGNPDLLMQFIESNHHIGNIAHIPLNLELICDVWSPDKAARWTHNVTGLYQEITKYFLERMEKKGVFPCDEARKEVLIELLGEIALEGMSSMKSIISPNEFGSIINRKERALATKGLLEELLGLGVIKVIPVNKEAKDNQVYFIHHTFQEYFAATHIAQGFICYQDDAEYKAAIAMLKEHKYTPYYEMMWIFVVGHLYMSCNQAKDYMPLFQFWDAFENEPRELLGIGHDRLLLRLLKTFPGKSAHEDLSKLRDELLNRTIVPELLKILSDCAAEPETRLRVIDAIVELQSTSADITAKLTEVMLREKEVEGVKLYAAEGLLRLGYNSKEALFIICKGADYLKVYISGALSRVYEVEGLDLEIKDEIENYLNTRKEIAQQNQLSQLNFTGFAFATLGSAIKIYNLENMVKEAKNIRDTAQRYQIHRQIIQDDQLQQMDLVALAANNTKKNSIKHSASNNASNVLGFLMAGLSIGGVVQVFSAAFGTANFIKTAAVLNSVCTGLGSITGVGTGLGIYYIAGHALYSLAYNQISYSIFQELDKLACDNDKSKLGAICAKANNNKEVVIAWSAEGLLNIVLAIRLYSYASQTALWEKSKNIWLEPMRDITFIYKDASIFLTIAGKGDNRHILERNLKEPLTKNWKETEEVIRTMKAAYEKAGLSTKLMDHYLSGKSLDVSTPTEKLAIARRVRSNRSMGFTALHKAAADGNMLEVQKLIETGEIDVNDFHNQDWETPLILAIKNKRWDVVEYLVDNGADVSTGWAIGLVDSNRNFIKQFDKMAIKGLLNQSALEKILRFSVDDYKIQTTPEGKKAVLNRLAKCITGEDRGWMEISNYRTDVYRLFLSNISAISRESINFGVIKGAMPAPILKMRLHVYLELYVRICALEPFDFPKINGEASNLVEVQDRLYGEIKAIIQTFTTASYEVSTELFHEYLESVYKKLLGFGAGEEFIFTSMTYEPHHCMYISLYKLNQNDVMIRADNRYLDGKYDSAIHGKAPYEADGEIKSCCIGILNLRDYKEALLYYISNIFKNGYGNEKFPHIYGRYLKKEIAIAYDKLPIEIQNYIREWPYHRYQATTTNNCTLSSYNLGISVRQGMEFCEWLIGKEQQIAPPFSSTNVKDIITSRHADDEDLLFGGSNGIRKKPNYTHVGLMDKFQKELKVPYSEVLIGITVEQTLVNMAGIKTSQIGASFRRYNDTSTVFHLVLTSFSEQQRFMNYYTTCYPDLISKSLLKEEIGQMSIFMDTRKLYEEIAPALGKYMAINKKENINAKWC